MIHICIRVLVDLIAFLSCPPFSLLCTGRQASRTSRKEKINAWRLNESDERWIDHNSKSGQQDCLFKGQDPLIIVLAEIDSQVHSVSFLTCRYLHPNATQPIKNTPRCRNANNFKLGEYYQLGELNINTSVPLIQHILNSCNKVIIDNRTNTSHMYLFPYCT